MTSQKNQEPEMENQTQEGPESQEPQEITEQPSESEKKTDETDKELAEEYLNDLKRCQAEFENYKKRQSATQKELGGYLIEKLVLDIIPVLDNFRSATQHVPPEQKDNAWVVGIQYIEKQLETVLTNNGVQMIEAREGEDFDPKIHEAVSTEARTEELESVEGKNNEQHIITKVIQKGYKFGDRVIRAARVIVK